MVGPVIYTYGNDAQKKKYLPPILSGDDWWCQGYSEPGSGSDLAAVRTKAIRDGEHYIVNGHKTSEHLARVGEAARVDVLPGPHRSPRQSAGRHFVPADRYEKPWRYRAPDHHHR